MTQDEIIEMARQAQVHEELCGEHFIYEFAKLIAAKEREACANLCEDQTQEYYSDGSKRAMNYQCADAIRARGKA